MRSSGPGPGSRPWVPTRPDRGRQPGPLRAPLSVGVRRLGPWPTRPLPRPPSPPTPTSVPPPSSVPLVVRRSPPAAGARRSGASRWCRRSVRRATSPRPSSSWWRGWRAASGSRPSWASPAPARAPPSPGPSRSCSGRCWSSPPTSRWPPSSPVSSGSSSPTTGQRRDRPAAPLGHRRPAHPARRHRGGVGVVHLRPGRPRGVPRPDAPHRGRPGDRPPGTAAAPGRHAVRAQRRQGAGRRDRGAPGLRGDGGAHRAVRRRDRADPGGRSTHGGAGPLRAGVRVPPRHALRGQPGADDGRHHPHRGRAAAATGAVRSRGQAAGGPAPPHAHPVRPGDDAGGGLLQRDRELLRPH